MKKRSLLSVLLAAGLLAGCDWTDKKEISLVCSATENVHSKEKGVDTGSETQRIT